MKNRINNDVLKNLGEDLHPYGYTFTVRYRDDKFYIKVGRVKHELTLYDDGRILSILCNYFFHVAHNKSDLFHNNYTVVPFAEDIDVEMECEDFENETANEVDFEKEFRILRSDIIEAIGGLNEGSLASFFLNLVVNRINKILKDEQDS